MIVTKDNVKEFIANGGVKVKMIYPIGVKHFELLESITIELKNGAIITIPEGLQFDGSSSPRFLWSILPSYGDFFFAALIHDWMYITDYRAKQLGPKLAQKYADKEMLFWSRIINRKNKLKRLDNKLRYFAVRLFGKKVYLR